MTTVWIFHASGRNLKLVVGHLPINSPGPRGTSNKFYSLLSATRTSHKDCQLVVNIVSFTFTFFTFTF